MYIITIKNRKFRFATLAEAKKTAQRIYERTGVVVGIERE